MYINIYIYICMNVFLVYNSLYDLLFHVMSIHKYFAVFSTGNDPILFYFCPGSMMTELHVFYCRLQTPAAIVDVPTAMLGLFIVILSSASDTAAISTPRSLPEWSSEMFTSAPLQTPAHHLPPFFCHPGANLAEISLDDCGSCQGRCEGLNTLNKREGLCSCDSACMVYDDCCWDFQHECSELHDRAVSIRNAFEVTPSSICFAMKMHTGRRNEVLLINSCGGTLYEPPTISNIPDPYSQVPVLDLDTGIFYINVNCAICNGAGRLQAVGVHLTYLFRINNDAPVIHQRGPTTNTAITTAAPVLSTADDVVEAIAKTPTISYSFPGTPARQCLRNVRDHCSQTCDNNDLVNLCQTGGQSYTTAFRDRVYRNIYCALCNEYPIDQLQCSDYRQVLPGARPSQDLSEFSLSFLFDLQELESPSVSSISLFCAMHDIELPEGVVCGETVCPRGYTLHEDTCRAISTDSSFLENGTHSNSSQYVSPCKGFRLPQSAFTIDNNSLVLITNGGDVYYDGEYIMENASAVICQNSTYTYWSARSELGITTIILCSISLLGLICRIILQPFRPQYKTFPGRMQFNLVLAMALAIALLLLSPLASDVDKLCFTLAMLKYYTFLASFVWMTCVSGDTWWALKTSNVCGQSQRGRSLLCYLLIGWLLPLILAVIVFSIDLSGADTSFAPQFGGRGCWISQKLPLILFFFVPFFICVTLNTMFFLLTVGFLKTAFEESHALQKSKDTQHPWQVYLKLFIIMGLAWLVGFVAIWVDSVIVWFLFIILNASQGVLIFMAFVVRFSKMKTMFQCFKHDRVSSGKRFSSDQTASTQTTNI